MDKDSEYIELVQQAQAEAYAQTHDREIGDHPGGRKIALSA